MWAWLRYNLFTLLCLDTSQLAARLWSWEGNRRPGIIGTGHALQTSVAIPSTSSTPRRAPRLLPCMDYRSLHVGITLTEFQHRYSALSVNCDITLVLDHVIVD